MDLYEALQNRRSVRKYEPEIVPEEKVNKVLEAARVAPSWKNMQCWRFIVVRDEEKKKLLAESLHEGNPAVKATANAPVVIVICANPEASGQLDGKEYYLLDAGIAMQQLMLSAHAEGLGTCWVAWLDEAKARAACKVPDDYKVVALTPLGIPAKQSSMPPRKELSEIVFQEEWSKNL